ALIDGDLATLHLSASSESAELLSPLLVCPRTWITEVIETLSSGETSRARDAPAETIDRRDTSLGGIFLLLPLLDELPLDEATAGWLPADEVPATNLVRFLLLSKSCGHLRAQIAFRDPLVRDLLLIPPAISPSLISEW